MPLKEPLNTFSCLELNFAEESIYLFFREFYDVLATSSVTDSNPVKFSESNVQAQNQTAKIHTQEKGKINKTSSSLHVGLLACVSYCSKIISDSLINFVQSFQSVVITIFFKHLHSFCCIGTCRFFLYSW